jgi:hypothetical protein
VKERLFTCPSVRQHVLEDQNYVEVELGSRFGFVLSLH